jgi:hypothetical protein
VTPIDETLRRTPLETAGPDIVAEDFGGEIVVLNLANGRYFSLPGLSADIWRDLAEGCTPGSLVESAMTVGVAMAEAVESIAAALVAEGLLRPRETPATSPLPKARFAGVETLPVMESYDDMADLILSDPIHDVDENVGWPVKKEDVPGA